MRILDTAALRRCHHSVPALALALPPAADDAPACQRLTINDQPESDFGETGSPVLRFALAGPLLKAFGAARRPPRLILFQ